MGGGFSPGLRLTAFGLFFASRLLEHLKGASGWQNDDCTGDVHHEPSTLGPIRRYISLRQRRGTPFVHRRLPGLRDL